MQRTTGYRLQATDPSPAEPEPQVHYRLRRAGMLLFQGFAPEPHVLRAENLRVKRRFRRVVLQDRAVTSCTKPVVRSLKPVVKDRAYATR